MNKNMENNNNKVSNREDASMSSLDRLDNSINSLNHTLDKFHNLVGFSYFVIVVCMVVTAIAILI